MADKILYLLGAGASAEALPLAKDNSNKPNGMASLSTAMNTLAESLKHPNFPVKSVEQSKFINEIAGDLLWLSKESKRFTTVDTFAKFLYITDLGRFDKLKRAVSVYFSIEQIHNKRLDNRYLVWLTSLLENKIMFPQNIKILNWNYDFQIQLTAEQFLKENLRYKDTVGVHSPPLIQYYPHIGHKGMYGPNEFSMLHLNGIAGFYQTSHVEQHVFLNHELNNDSKYLDNLIKNVQYQNLYFAWESQYQVEPIKIINEMAKDVTILVVIGYSFPFFNRYVDMEVYKALRQVGNLKKIYFQDPNRDGSFLRAQFGYTDDIAIRHIPETDALYIPFEL